MAGLSRTLVAVTLVCCLSAVASAQVPWTNPSGTGTWFDWYGGQNAGTLWGSPTFISGTQSFRFTPINFRASSTDGNPSGQISDTAQWNVVTHPGHVFTGL